MISFGFWQACLSSIRLSVISDTLQIGKAWHDMRHDMICHFDHQNLRTRGKLV